MRLPVIQGTIERRLLINYRVDPAGLKKLLPAPFRPQLVAGHGIAGLCLIRFRGLRPRGWPTALGFSSENAAHRVAVEWEADGATQQGVYIIRRQTDSRWNAWAGGRVFPGVQDLADFSVADSPDRLRIAVAEPNGAAVFIVTARTTSDWPTTSVFRDLPSASRFFEGGAKGYSPGRGAQAADGMKLHVRNWRVTPLDIEYAESAFFQDESLFPRGSAELDCGLLMRGIEHEWHSLPTMCCEAAPR